MRALIVIVNYRSADLVIDCLRSLEPEVRDQPGVRVAITDNASGDESVAVLRDAIAKHDWADWAAVIPLPKNGGFAYGNNCAIAAAMKSFDPSDYFWLLNPDTIVRPGALSTLLGFMDAHPAAGIAGSRLEHRDATVQPSAFRFHSIFGEVDTALRLGAMSRLLSRWVVAPPPPRQASRTDWLSGASLFVRTKVFEDIGLLDESYFMYFEETDLCLRADRAGWECWYVPESRVVHLVGQSSGFDSSKSVKPPPKWWFDSRRRYYVKNHGRAYALVADAAWASGYALWRLRRLVQRKPDTDPPKLLSLFLRNSTLTQGFRI